jgi:hypothetical protein
MFFVCLLLLQVFIHSSDTDGRALLGRFQTKTQDLQSDDQEVKVQVYISRLFFPPKHSTLTLPNTLSRNVQTSLMFKCCFWFVLLPLRKDSLKLKCEKVISFVPFTSDKEEANKLSLSIEYNIITNFKSLN